MAEIISSNYFYYYAYYSNAFSLLLNSSFNVALSAAICLSFIPTSGLSYEKPFTALAVFSQFSSPLFWKVPPNGCYPRSEGSPCIYPFICGEPYVPLLCCELGCLRALFISADVGSPCSPFD
jgi:hypothetical protein